MTRRLLLSYAVLPYLWFLADLVWAILFLADIGNLADPSYAVRRPKDD